MYDAQKLLKRSSTQNIAAYWADKVKNYEVKNFSRIVSLHDGEANDKAFRKMVLSHVTNNVLFHDNPFFDPGSIYDSILGILCKILDITRKKSICFRYDSLMSRLREDNILELITDFLKIISRPFIAYDFKAKLQTMTLLLIFSEFLIDNHEFTAVALKSRMKLQESPYKSFLFQEGRIDETFRILKIIKTNYLQTKADQIKFLQDCVLDNLVELRSTYMIRKNTMRKVNLFLLEKQSDGQLKEHNNAEKFWAEYVAGVHKILDCNSDETRSLWLEYLLLSGDEYLPFQLKYENQKDGVFPPMMLYEELTKDVDIEICDNSAFYHFCDELFLQNSRVLFDGLEHFNDVASENAYFMECWKRFRALNSFHVSIKKENVRPTDTELTLFKDLNYRPDGSWVRFKEGEAKYKVKERYDTLLKRIAALAKDKYHFNHTDIALITLPIHSSEEGENRALRLNQFDFVSSSLSSAGDSYFNKYEIKTRLYNEIVLNKKESDLLKYGYKIELQGKKESPFLFVYFCDVEQSIIPVYLYFSFKDSKEPLAKCNMHLFLRDILSYRNRILRMLQNDFAGDIFSKYAHTSGEKSILAHEKATSHNTTGDDSVTLEFFTDPKFSANYEALDSDQALKWLLLRNYTNAQIAKLFNRSYRSLEEYDVSSNYPTPPPLYLQNVDSKILRKVSVFKRPLRSFSDLHWLEDGRFSLLESVVSFKFEGWSNVSFINNSETHEYYNVEYFKNVLIDIILSAIKYCSSRSTYLERIDSYLVGAKQKRYAGYINENIVQKGCEVQFRIEESEVTKEKPFNYLVIKNNVDKNAHNLFDWKTHNEVIEARLRNPIDYADGHMSLLAISQYIEGLWQDALQGETKFRYVKDNGELVFETWLPIIRKGE